jgi:glutamate synthase domain-containing protein 2
MWLLLLPLKLRYMLLGIALLGFAAVIAEVLRDPILASLLAAPLAFFAFFSILGLRDFFQTRHAILRNYPITAHLRFLFEKIRPEMRQYFFEDDKTGLPFPRDKRAIVYQRAKGALDKRPFGTEYDVYQSHYEWLHHSVAPKSPAQELFRITIGGPDCTQPYSASGFRCLKWPT